MNWNLLGVSRPAALLEIGPVYFLSAVQTKPRPMVKAARDFLNGNFLSRTRECFIGSILFWEKSETYSKPLLLSQKLSPFSLKSVRLRLKPIKKESAMWRLSWNFIPPRKLQRRLRSARI